MSGLDTPDDERRVFIATGACTLPRVITSIGILTLIDWRGSQTLQMLLIS